MYLKVALIIGIFGILFHFFFTDHLLELFKSSIHSFVKETESYDFPICTHQRFMDYDLVYTKHLAVLGHVFDVSSKPEFYGVEGSYKFFTGKDASRSFATGDFTEKGLVSNVEGLSTNEIGEVISWLLYMRNAYKCVGFVPGLYFNIMGQYSDYLNEIRAAWLVLLEQRKLEDKAFPACSLETVGDSVKMYCPNSNNFPKRYPRKLLVSGTTKPRCTCVEMDFRDPRVQFYDGCEYTSEVCTIANK